MQASEISQALERFIVDKLLDGEGDELDENTPLLEWGVIDSLAMVALLDFIKIRFGVAVPDDDVSPRNFASIGTLTKMIVRMLGQGPDHA